MRINCQLEKNPCFPYYCSTLKNFVVLILALCIYLAPFASGTLASATAGATEQVTNSGLILGNALPLEPPASDQAINERLTEILSATGWFDEFGIQVNQGVVFLDGQIDSDEHRQQVIELIQRVPDVVLVVNRLEVIEASPWDFTPALTELNSLWQNTLKMLPRIGLALVVFAVIAIIFRILIRFLRSSLDNRLKPLLHEVIIRLATVFGVVIGCYFILQIAGLSGLAATVLGGTGIAGLVAGIAFRDILENYLASILISLRNPFKIGDLVEIGTDIGIVERVTTRGTVLMNMDGNHIQIPNAIIYKSIIRNFTANPNRRETFEVGVGFENEAGKAQELALGVIVKHPAVLQEPEPLVLVDRLGAATVALRIYFWYDGSRYNGLKLRSALIRLVKNSFENEHISMPDEAREIIFPEPVSVVTREFQPKISQPQKTTQTSDLESAEAFTTRGEGSLTTEQLQLRGQAKAARNPEEGADLLQNDKN